MAVGYIFAGKRIKGSCGGMNNLVTGDDGKEKCSLCGISYEEQLESGCAESVSDTDSFLDGIGDSN